MGTLGEGGWTWKVPGASFLGKKGRVGKNGNLEDFLKIELFEERKGVVITPKSKAHKRKNGQCHFIRIKNVSLKDTVFGYKTEKTSCGLGETCQKLT